MNRAITRLGLATLVAALVGGPVAAQSAGGSPQRASAPTTAKKPAATKQAAAKKGPASRKRLAAKPPAMPRAAAKPVPRASVARPAGRAPAAATAAQRNVEPAARVQLGQMPASRYYPNGIPELRPGFLYPVQPERPPVQADTGPELPWSERCCKAW